jgi:hypothetical protein
MDINVIIFADKGKESAGHKGHFALYTCLVIGHTKFNGVLRVYCNLSLRNHFMAVTNWTSSFFSHLASIMEDLWSHLTLFDVLGVCSYFLSKPKPTRAPRRLIVLSCRHLKHTTILTLEIIDFTAIICIMDIIGFKHDLS